MRTMVLLTEGHVSARYAPEGRQGDGVVGPDVPRVSTSGAWQVAAQTAYNARLDQMRRRYRALFLANTVRDLAGIDLDDLGVDTGAHETVVIDGVVFTVVGAGPGEAGSQISAGVVCQFCERANFKPFKTLADLGEVLAAPTGSCGYCAHALAE